MIEKQVINSYPGNLLCIDVCVNCRIIRTIDAKERKYSTTCRLNLNPIMTDELDQDGYPIYDCDFVEDHDDADL